MPVSSTENQNRRILDQPKDMVISGSRLSFDKTGNDTLHNKDEWDYNLKSLTNYQEQIGFQDADAHGLSQDFIGQHNAFCRVPTLYASANRC